MKRFVCLTLVLLAAGPSFADCNLDASGLDTMQSDLSAAQGYAAGGDVAAACKTIRGLAAKLQKASEALRACGDNASAENINGSLKQIQDVMGQTCADVGP